MINSELENDRAVNRMVGRVEHIIRFRSVNFIFDTFRSRLLSNFLYRLTLSITGVILKSRSQTSRIRSFEFWTGEGRADSRLKGDTPTIYDISIEFTYPDRIDQI